MMDLTTFEDGLDRWGGALTRWPAAERGEAETLLSASAAARALHARMAEVEAILAAGVTSWHPDAGFAAIATRHAQQRRTSPLARRTGWGVAVAAALALGIVVGNVGHGVLHEDNVDSVLASALDSGTGAVDVD